jgi:hypothetical protein
MERSARNSMAAKLAAAAWPRHRAARADCGDPKAHAPAQPAPNALPRPEKGQKSGLAR